jgi:carboxypeptidase D
MNNYANIFGLNQTFVKAINQRAELCGFPQYMENVLQYPPKGKFQEPVNASSDACAIWEDILEAALYVNPCFNFYHLTGKFLFLGYTLPITDLLNCRLLPIFE